MKDPRPLPDGGADLDVAALETAERELAGFADHIGRIESEMSRVIVGQRVAVRQLLVCLLAGGHALLEGVPGVGKTLLVKSLARVLGLDFSRVQCTPDLIPADVTGTNVLHEDDGHRSSLRFRFQPGPIFASVVLADEINRATPKAQSAFLEAMQERQVTVAGVSHPLPEPFLVMATQNPIEMEGTFPLPEAQLDRFMFKILVPYPDASELRRIAVATTDSRAPHLRAVAGSGEVIGMQRLVRRIPIATEMVDAVVGAVQATNPSDPSAPEEVRRFVRYGASPRAAQAVVLGAKAEALLSGRCHVAPADVKAALAPALRHRILPGFEAHASRVGIEEILLAVERSAAL